MEPWSDGVNQHSQVLTGSCKTSWPNFVPQTIIATCHWRLKPSMAWRWLSSLLSITKHGLAKSSRTRKITILCVRSLETPSSFDNLRIGHDMETKFTSIDFSHRFAVGSRSSWLQTLSNQLIDHSPYTRYTNGKSYLLYYFLVILKSVKWMRMCVVYVLCTCVHLPTRVHLPRKNHFILPFMYIICTTNNRTSYNWSVWTLCHGVHGMHIIENVLHFTSHKSWTDPLFPKCLLIQI